jgi:hypothetical protein
VLEGEVMITEKRLHEIIDQAGFRVDGNEVLSRWREGVDISDDVMTLITLVAEECIAQVGHFEYGPDGEEKEFASDILKYHFGLG